MTQLSLVWMRTLHDGYLRVDHIRSIWLGGTKGGPAVIQAEVAAGSGDGGQIRPLAIVPESQGEHLRLGLICAISETAARDEMGALLVVLDEDAPLGWSIKLATSVNPDQIVLEIAEPPGQRGEQAASGHSSPRHRIGSPVLPLSGPRCSRILAGAGIRIARRRGRGFTSLLTCAFSARGHVAATFEGCSVMAQ